MSSSSVPREERPAHVVYEDGDPHVMGGHCTACGAIMFPRRETCRSCGGEAIDQLIFDREATLETYSIVHMAKPGFDPPYPIGFVRLFPGNIRAFSPIETDDFEQLAVGMPVEITEITRDDRQLWAVRPAGGES